MGLPSLPLIPVVLCGGSGTRLWPLSRPNHPKQFLSLVSENSLLQDTMSRLEGLPETKPPMLVCGHEHRFLVVEQLQAMGCQSLTLLLEPVSRNTAPAVTVTALQVVQHFPHALLLVLPSDHVIQDIQAFHEAVRMARISAEAGRLVTFGIVPDTPKTGYGYIERGSERTDAQNGANLYDVARFIEKPDAQHARTFLESGRFYWNSGMFLFRADVLLEEMARWQPGILESCQKALKKSVWDQDVCLLDPMAFAASPSLSMDYAVMEKTDRAVVTPVKMGWSDVGSWQALWELMEKDAQGNAVHGHFTSIDLRHTQHCLIHHQGPSAKHVAMVGVSDLIVVETEDALLIVSKSHEQEVREIAQKGKTDQAAQTMTHLGSLET